MYLHTVYIGTCNIIYSHTHTERKRDLYRYEYSRKRKIHPSSCRAIRNFLCVLCSVRLEDSSS